MTEEIITYFKNKKWFRDRIEHIEEIAPRRARYAKEKIELPKVADLIFKVLNNYHNKLVGQN